MRSCDDQSKQSFFNIIFYGYFRVTVEENAKTHTLQGPVNAKAICGLFFPNHIASVFDLLSSNPEQLLKVSNFSKRFTTESVSPTKQVSSAYCESLYSFPLIFIPLSTGHFLLNLLKFQQQLQRVNQKADTPV